jgi:hypothetical protein
MAMSRKLEERNRELEWRNATAPVPANLLIAALRRVGNIETAIIA